MPDEHEIQSIVDSAGQAASLGDFVRAERLLREAVALQVTLLGPRHPDLIETLNNLAVACEKTDEVADAEQFYRRAYAVASASLDARHPLVAASRDNLRDFCHGRGLSFEDEDEVADASPVDVAASDPLAAEFYDAPRVLEFPPAAAAPPPRPAAHVEASVLASPAPDPSSAPRPHALPPLAPVSMLPVAPRPAAVTGNRGLAVAVAMVAMIGTGAALWLWRAPAGDGRSAAIARVSPDPSAADQSAAAAPPVAAPGDETRALTNAPTSPAPSTPVAIEPPAAPLAPPSAPIAAPRATAPAAAPGGSTPGGLRVVTATVCRTLATAVGAWRCEAAGDPSAPGRLLYYTRVASERPVQLRHRWYQGDRLRHDARFDIGANVNAGYRTYSGWTVRAGDWRVELVDASGAVLADTRFTVRE